MPTTIALKIAVLAAALTLPVAAKAHPGGKAADGCHYCRTRCDYWGVPWNERHCHGAERPAPMPTPVKRQSKPKPVKPLPATPVPAKKATPESDWDRLTVYVTAVSDGDTIKVRTKTEPYQRFRVRLLGLDCPEAADGLDATRHVAKRVLSKTVVLQAGARKFAKDRFGRTLAYVELMGVDLGEELIGKGLCRDYSHKYPHPRQQRYLSASNGSR